MSEEQDIREQIHERFGAELPRRPMDAYLTGVFEELAISIAERSDTEATIRRLELVHRLTLWHLHCARTGAPPPMLSGALGAPTLKQDEQLELEVLLRYEARFDARVAAVLERSGGLAKGWELSRYAIRLAGIVAALELIQDLAGELAERGELESDVQAVAGAACLFRRVLGQK